MNELAGFPAIAGTTSARTIQAGGMKQQGSKGPYLALTTGPAEPHNRRLDLAPGSTVRLAGVPCSASPRSPTFICRTSSRLAGSNKQNGVAAFIRGQFLQNALKFGRRGLGGSIERIIDMNVPFQMRLNRRFSFV